MTRSEQALLALGAVALVACGPSSTPSSVDGGLTSLGSVAAGTAVRFEVPPGTLGFSLTIEATAPVTQSDFLGVKELVAPDGTKRIAEFRDVAFPNARQTTGGSGAGFGVIGLPLPNDRAGEPLPSGQWTVTLGGLTGGKGSAAPYVGTVRGSVRFQTSSDGTFHGGALDLDVYVPDGLRVGPSTITAATAAANPDLSERLRLGFGLLERLIGVKRGDVRFHPLPASWLLVDGQADVEAVNRLATSVGAAASAQLVLTNTLNGDSGGPPISGVSNCLPGVVGMGGTVCTAVIVSLRDNAPAWQDAAVWLHELSHFVGLRHTSEFGSTSFDNLADTPDCLDTSKAGIPQCADRENLMFPSANNATAIDTITLSATQRALWRASPLYRAAP